MSETNFRMPAPTWLDRAVNWVSPAAGLNRYRARIGFELALHLQRSEVLGTGLNRLRGDFTNSIKDASASQVDRAAVRNMSRDLIQGNAYASGLIQRIVANVVGRGITPQCGLTPDTAEDEPLRKPAGWTLITESRARLFQTQAEELWAEFAESCDVAGRMSFYEIEQVIEEALSGSDGEILVHLPALERPGRPVSFAVELIEADRLETPTGQITNRNIREGVQIAPETGEPVAYWIRDTHPGDTQAISIGKYRQIPRLNPDGSPRILHLFRQRRAGQVRGYSPFAPSLSIFQDLHRYWEAEIVAARVAACSSMTITSPASYQLQQAAGTTNASGRREQTLEPGRILYLMPGETSNFGDMTRPNSQFGAFTETLLRAIGVCHNLPFELIALDFSKTNYSSARASLLEGRRSFQQKQRFLCDRLGSPIWQMVVLEGIGRGRLDAPGFSARKRDYLQSFWTPPSWGWVDPTAEETASRDSIRNFLSTHSEELAAQGRDMDQVFEQCAREHKKLKKLDLPSPWDALMAGAAPMEKGEPAAKPGKQPVKVEE